MADQQQELDPVATKELARAFAVCIRGHYRSRPIRRDTVLEVLNALAAAAAIVITGVGDGQTDGAAIARGFFEAALEQNILDAREGTEGTAS